MLRNVGVPMGHMVISIQSTLKGLRKLLLNQDAINRFDKKKKKKKKKGGDKSAVPKGEKQPQPENGGNKGNANGGERRQQPRQGKPRRPQQPADGPQQQSAPSQQPRREKPQRLEKKTFRPRKAKDGSAPENANGQSKQTASAECSSR